MLHESHTGRHSRDRAGNPGGRDPAARPSADGQEHQHDFTRESEDDLP